ncbi:hypothetical protein EGI22_22885 [Lacihabitans sp. LS3-19]|uniref:hypothetical protein n=1 Tax=Lacihabitans sp. LS3-19 TaxID=2487335 RepID=UPI0020CDCC28|nr:hypothetical protein [Lacihabitans sp. LS3-19]MCP9770760.1 hypothetical protein [Lacihabitans sp. LS3-19]
MFSVLFKSFISLSKKLPLVLFFCGVGFVLAMLVARPFYVTFLSEANGSVALDKLVADFDFMVFTDFLQQSGKAFRPFVALAMIIGVVYLFLNTFFAGGILQVFDEEKFKLSEFFEGSTKYFSKFALLLVFLFIFLLVLVSLAGMFFFIFAAIAEGGNEKDYILAMLPPLGILAYFVGFVIVLGDYARVMLYKSETLKVYDAFWKSFSYVFKRQSTLALFWLIIILGLILSVMYLGVDKVIGMHSGLTIFVMFLVQQVFVFVRTFLKISTLVVAKNYFESKPVVLEKVIVPLEESPQIEN